MSRKEIFALAAQELKLTVQSEKTAQTDDDMFVTEVQITNMLAAKSYHRETKKFTGKPGPTPNLSIENAYQIVLKTLEDEKRIQIDDYNAARVLELEAELFRSNTWLMLFENKAKKLKDDFGQKNAALWKLFPSFDSLCQQTTALLAVLRTEQGASPRKKTRRNAVPSSGTAPPAPNFGELSDGFLKLRTEFLSLLGDSDQAGGSNK